MSSSVNGVIKVFLIVLIITLATIGLLGVLDVMEQDKTKDLLFKSSAVIGVLGLASILIAVLSGSKDDSKES
jgi:uncharacterized membrane protein